MPVRTAIDALDLPPPYTELRLREAGDAVAEAIARAPAEGAGLLVHVGRLDLVEFAVVLEPEEPLRTARRALFAGMAALADAVAAHAAPERSVRIGWPDAIVYDGARLGGGRLAWPAGAAEDRAPDWLVFGAQLIAARHRLTEAGQAPGSTSLIEEGFDDGRRLIESFARHLMLHLDAWAAEGFGAVERRYLEHLVLSKAGARRWIDAGGDLLTQGHGAAAAERSPLLPAIAAPGWYDPARRGPRI